MTIVQRLSCSPGWASGQGLLTGLGGMVSRVGAPLPLPANWSPGAPEGLEEKEGGGGRKGWSEERKGGRRKRNNSHRKGRAL